MGQRHKGISLFFDLWPLAFSLHLVNEEKPEI
jgi:hypothetical protein